MHYCIYTQDIVSGLFPALQQLTDCHYEIHANRTRFHLDCEQAAHLQFYIKYSHLLVCIDHESDHVLGR